MAGKDGKIPTKGVSSAQDNWIHTAQHNGWNIREMGAAQEQQNRIDSETSSADKADEMLAIVDRKAFDKRVGTFITKLGGKKRRKTRRKRKYTRWDLNPRSRSTGS